MLELLLFSIVWALSGVASAYWFLKATKKEDGSINDLDIAMSSLFCISGVIGLILMSLTATLPKITNYLNDKL